MMYQGSNSNGKPPSIPIDGRVERLYLGGWGHMAKGERETLEQRVGDAIGGALDAIVPGEGSEALDLLMERRMALVVADLDRVSAFRVLPGVENTEILGQAFEAYSDLYADRFSVIDQFPRILWELPRGFSVVIPKSICPCQLDGLTKLVDEDKPVMGHHTQFQPSLGKLVRIQCPTYLLNSTTATDEQRRAWLKVKLGRYTLETVRQFPSKPSRHGR